MVTPRAINSLAGQFLVALPTMTDPRFSRVVIYLVSHGPEGTMGLIVNRPLSSMSFADLLSQLEIPYSENTPALRIHYGGPVETGRGFVLHTDDFRRDGTTVLENGLAMTSTIDALRALADRQGPAQALLVLGYAGWQAGQLEAELQGNGWLTVPADPALLFDADLDTKWERTIAMLGITPAALSVTTGRA